MGRTYWLVARWLVAGVASLGLFALTWWVAHLLGLDPASAFGVSGAVLTIALSVAGVWAAAPPRVVEEAAQKTLEQRLDELSDSMRASAQIVQQITTELDAQAATAKRLKEEAETAEAISRLHKEESEAVRRMLDAQLETVSRKIRSDSIKLGVASFVAGSGVAYLVTLLVHPLH
jgi:hypothetical protein